MVITNSLKPGNSRKARLKSPLNIMSLPRAASIWRADLWEKAGASAYAGRNYPEAVRLFSIARDHNSLSAEAWDMFGSAYWLNDDHATALETWQSGVEEISFKHRAV